MTNSDFHRSAGIESAADTEMYRLRDLIASHIACEDDCQKMPTGCGCALTAARAVMNAPAQSVQVPKAWFCFVPSPPGEEEPLRIRAWTTDAERAKRIGEVIGREFEPLYASQPSPAATVETENDHNCECSVCAERYAQLHCSAGSDTPLQAIVQQAIMAHPHFEGSATLAFGLAGAALTAMPSEPQASSKTADDAIKALTGLFSILRGRSYARDHYQLEISHGLYNELRDVRDRLVAERGHSSQVSRPELGSTPSAPDASIPAQRPRG